MRGEAILSGSAIQGCANELKAAPEDLRRALIECSSRFALFAQKTWHRRVLLLRSPATAAVAMNSQDASPGNLSALNRISPVRVKIGDVRWELRSAAVAESVQPLLREPDAPLAKKDSLIHDTWLVSVARVSMSGIPGGPWLLRRSNYAKPSARQRDFFRVAAPVRAFRNALAMEQAGVPTPRVLAAGVIRKWRVPRTGYLLVEEIPSATTLAKLAEQSGPVSQSALRRTGEAVARLHELGFIHGDLTINNVLLDDDGQPWFVDLERARRVRGAVNWRQAVEDFHRFARHVGKFRPAARLGALRLLKHYCAARGWVGRERAFAEAVFQRVKHKIAEDRME